MNVSTHNIVHGELPLGYAESFRPLSIETDHILEKHFGEVGKEPYSDSAKFSISVEEVQAIVNHLMRNGIGKRQGVGEDAVLFHYTSPTKLGHVPYFPLHKNNIMPLCGMKLVVGVRASDGKATHIKSVFPCAKEGNTPPSSF